MLDPAWKPLPSARATIVFVHGAVVNGLEMGLLRRRMAGLGYRVRQFHYRSMDRGLEDNARRLREFIGRTEGDTLHVVGHSMGGVLARRVFEGNPDPRPGRLIAIGSPFLDCWTGRRISRRLHRFLIGKTVHDHLAQPPDPVWRGKRDVGIVAGTYPFGVGALFPDLPRPNDGVVLWEETQLGGAADHVTFRINHFGMLVSHRCYIQIARFLAEGTFAR